MMVKWASVLVAVLSVALDGMANLLLALTGPHHVPIVVNIIAVAVALAATLMAFTAHLYGRLDAKLDLVIELLVGRFDELENRVGDRNSGFVEGYMLSHTPTAPVVPLTPRGFTRRAAAHADD